MLRVSKDKLKKKKIEELEKNTGEWEEEKKKLVEDLKAKWKPVDDEPEDVKDLKTRAELVKKIKVLRFICFEMVQATFDMEVYQVKFLNPELNSEGIGMRAKIINMKLIPGSLEEDEEE